MYAMQHFNAIYNSVSASQSRRPAGGLHTLPLQACMPECMHSDAATVLHSYNLKESLNPGVHELL